MSKELQRFDREMTLADLMTSTVRVRLEQCLEKLIGGHWGIVDVSGRRLAGSGAQDVSSRMLVGIRLGIDEIGFLIAGDCTLRSLEGAAGLIECVIASECRYQMASSLHLEAVHADYHALQEQHAALQDSEARYRKLAAQLDARVNEQVAVLEKTQRQLYQSEKLASIGCLAAGVAHEINNPIGFIRGNLVAAADYVERLGSMCQVVQDKAPSDPALFSATQGLAEIMDDFPMLLEESISGVDRIARIVANLKAFSSVDTVSEAPGDLNDALKAALGIIEDQLSPSISIRMDLSRLPDLQYDRGLMNQAFLALLQNARQAMEPGGGTLHVASRHVDGEVVISIRDTGCGMTEELKNRIFDPFFTTRAVGRGMGLGLTVCRDIVLAHRGRIDVDTKPGAGSCFTVRIPCADNIAQVEPQEATQ